ncbi:hypothetical protein [Bradyrhizobium ottawaense]|uniref:hypothetical protein n=1 Tax=Bradyrhizobium ottawaense TaxID=931866 RepID=UPI0030F45D0A
MSRRRRQYTDFWIYFEAALRVISKRSWRRLGEELLGLERGELRLVDNAALSDEVLRVIEDLVSQAMHDRAAELRAQADEIERAAHVFEGKAAVRRFDVKTAEIKDCNDYAEAFANQWCEENVIGWKEKEAA